MREIQVMREFQVKLCQIDINLFSRQSSWLFLTDQEEGYILILICYALSISGEPCSYNVCDVPFPHVMQ